MKIFLAHATSFDFKNKLYIPLRASALNSAHEITCPEEGDHIWNTKEAIAASDVVVADVSVHSTGCGIELGWAEALGTPIICIHEKGSTPSSVVRYVTDTLIEYEDAETLVERLTSALEGLPKK